MTDRDAARPYASWHGMLGMVVFGVIPYLARDLMDVRGSIQPCLSAALYAIQQRHRA